MKVSIVTAYYNRRKLFYNTLVKLKHSTFTDFEVIAVDDGSADDNRLEDLQKEFPFLTVIRIEPQDKWYGNACIPFNIGFKAAKGEIVLIQNPECLHYGDILGHVVENLKPNDYISFACYSLDKETTDGLNQTNVAQIDSTISVEFHPRKVGFDGDLGWYNHSSIYPRGFHWGAAIYRTDLIQLKGFDERFALGIACDDCEFLFRVRQKGMNFKIVDFPFVLHQNHYYFDLERRNLLNQAYEKPDGNFLWRKNEYLFNRTVKREKWKIKALSKREIFLYDFFLTRKLKTRQYLSSLYLRVKARIAIIKQRWTSL